MFPFCRKEHGKRSNFRVSYKNYITRAREMQEVVNIFLRFLQLFARFCGIYARKTRRLPRFLRMFCVNKRCIARAPRTPAQETSSKKASSISSKTFKLQLGFENEIQATRSPKARVFHVKHLARRLSRCQKNQMFHVKHFAKWSPRFQRRQMFHVKRWVVAL